MNNKEFFGEIKAVGQSDDWELIIEARPSTADIDRYKEITDPDAFLAAMPDYMAKQPVMMFNHQYDWTIGKVLSYRADEIGPIITGGIAKTDKGKEVATLIRAGVVSSMSFMFNNTTYEDDPDNPGIQRLTGFDVLEIGPVSIPANTEAVIIAAKAAKIDEETIKALIESTGGGGSNDEKGRSMPNTNVSEVVKKIEGLVGDQATAIETVDSKVQAMSDLLDSQGKTLALATEAHQKLAGGVITKADSMQLFEKMNTDFVELRKEIQKGQNARKVIEGRAAVLDWDMKVGGLMEYRDDNGVPWSEVKCIEHAVFAKPLDLKTVKNGELIKHARRLNDICYYSMVYNSRKSWFDPRGLKSYQLLKELMPHILGEDNEFVKAMYTTGTNLGEEWVPTGMSSELIELFRLEAVVAPTIPTFEMPTGPSYTWPFTQSGPTVYRVGEAASDNPDKMLRSSLGTNKITFTAETFGVNVPVSAELVEDAIVAITSEISSEMAKAMAHSEDSRIINGDNTGTHRDTGRGWDATNPETYENGFREMAEDLSSDFDVLSGSAGVGDGTTAYVATDVRYCRKLCGKLGVPARGKFLSGVQGHFHLLGMTEFTQPGTYNAGESWKTGQLSAVDGSELLISEDVPEDLTSAGIHDGVTETDTVIIWYRPDQFKMGTRRGWTVEMEKDIHTQQWSFVGTKRSSFQKMSPSTDIPVAVGYNVLS